jgi:hypothetical protein
VILVEALQDNLSQTCNTQSALERLHLNFAKAGAFCFAVVCEWLFMPYFEWQHESFLQQTIGASCRRSPQLLYQSNLRKNAQLD